MVPEPLPILASTFIISRMERWRSSMFWFLEAMCLPVFSRPPAFPERMTGMFFPLWAWPVLMLDPKRTREFSRTFEEPSFMFLSLLSR